MVQEKIFLEPVRLVTTREIKSFNHPMVSDQPYIPFSQRNGLAPIPPQMKLGELSPELRRALSYYLELEVKRISRLGSEIIYFSSDGKRLAKDAHVFFFGCEPETFSMKPSGFEKALRALCKSAPFHRVLDLVEFLDRHPICSSELKQDLANAFSANRSPYRIIDGLVVTIGVADQGAAFEKALAAAQSVGSGAARTHLINAGKAITDGQWAACVRDSIHAVEAISVWMAPGAKTLGKALAVLERSGRLHSSLKLAFNQLYGYSSDEKGVRHALVFEDSARVDEADALFMLGACAAFVSYLVSRGGTVKSLAP